MNVDTRKDEIMAKKDVNAILNHFKPENRTGMVYILKDCSKSKAYSIKRAIDKQINHCDRFCEVKYDKDTKTAYFDIVS